MSSPEAKQSRSSEGDSAEDKDENSTASIGKLVEGKSKESWSLEGKPVEGIAGREVTRTSKLRAFTFAELQSATRNFRRDGVIEDGAYGTVFKGYLDENVSQFASYGGTRVAVKVLTSESMIFYRDLVVRPIALSKAKKVCSWGHKLTGKKIKKITS